MLLIRGTQWLTKWIFLWITRLFVHSLFFEMLDRKKNSRIYIVAEDKNESRYFFFEDNEIWSKGCQSHQCFLAMLYTTRKLFHFLYKNYLHHSWNVSFWTIFLIIYMIQSFSHIKMYFSLTWFQPSIHLLNLIIGYELIWKRFNLQTILC